MILHSLQSLAFIPLSLETYQQSNEGMRICRWEIALSHLRGLRQTYLSVLALVQHEYLQESYGMHPYSCLCRLQMVVGSPSMAVGIHFLPMSEFISKVNILTELIKLSSFTDALLSLAEGVIQVL